jgi:hypothetical protein
MYEKYNNKLHGKGKDKKEKKIFILTKSAADNLAKSWIELREK